MGYISPTYQSIKETNQEDTSSKYVTRASYIASIFALIIILLTISILTVRYNNSEQYLDEWNKFKATYGKKYSSPDEEVQRMSIFFSNLYVIYEINASYKKGLSSFSAAVNHLSDRTNAEAAGCINMRKAGTRLPDNSRKGRRLNETKIGNLPPSVDWRQKGAVTPVKNQGACGSCYAFSTTGSVEAAHFLSTGSLVSLSEQNLIDCVYSDAGCVGGWMANCFQYIVQNGVDTEASYPYEQMEDSCSFKTTSIGATISSYVSLEPGEDELQEAVAKYGPVSVAIDATGRFQSYSRGIFQDYDCDGQLNHAVLVVGYGSENGADYWIVKNSWGSDWGEDGYIRMARNYDDMCQISSQASYPVV